MVCYGVMIVELMCVLGVASGWLVIGNREEVKSVIYLVLVYVNMGGVLLSQGLDYMGVVLMVVYISAVMILFLFVVMMLVPRGEKREDSGDIVVGLVLGACVAAGLEREGVVGVVGVSSSWLSVMDSVRNVESVGQVLFSSNIGEVLVGGLVLLVALIGCIRLSRVE